MYRLAALMVFCVLSGCSLFLGPQTPHPRFSCNDVRSLDELVQQQIVQPEGVAMPEQGSGYLAGCVDLNHDGHEEIFVLMQHRWFCGSGGCSAYVFDDAGHPLTKMTVTKNTGVVV